MGAAIPVMHYTGMAAASFTPSGMPADLSHAASISTLGTAGIAAVTFVVLGLALLTSWVDRRFAAQALERQEEKLQRSEGVFGGSAEAHAHRKLGLARSGRRRLASVRGMVPHLWLRSRKWPADF